MPHKFKLVTLADELVVLRPLTPNDFEELYDVAADPLVWEQHPLNDRWKREVFQSFFAKALAGRLAYVITDKLTGGIIGSSRYYDVDTGNDTVAIGYTFLARKYWGGSYNHSVKKLMIDLAFKTFGRVVFHIGVNNIRSQKAIEKIAAIKEQELPADENNDHSRFEYAVYRNSTDMK